MVEYGPEISLKLDEAEMTTFSTSMLDLVRSARMISYTFPKREKAKKNNINKNIWYASQ